MKHGTRAALRLAAVVAVVLLSAGCEPGVPADRWPTTAPNAAPTPSYAYKVIDVPGAATTQIYKMNASGDAVGVYVDSRGSHGFWLRDSSYRSIDIAGATNTFARGINGRGEIVGTYQMATKPHGFTMTPAGVSTFDVPGANATRLWDISDLGEILGEYQLVAGGPWRPFTWRSGVLKDLSVPNANMSAGYGINGNGEVVGHFTVSGDTKMFGFKIAGAASTVLNHPASGTQMSCAQGIGNHGEVVGHYKDGISGIVYGYVWGAGQFVDTLRVPGAMETYAMAITPSGTVAGYHMDAAHVLHGFIAVPPPHPWGTKW